MKRKHFIIALMAMLFSFSFTTSAQELLVNCDYNSSTEGWGTTKFSNYAGAYAYATANSKTSATIVIEKTNTLSGNTFDNNHKNYSKLAVVIEDGATMGNALSKWDMTYPVTVKPGGTLTCARSASVSNIHIKNKLIVGAKGATKKAYVNFLSDSYQDCDISIRYNGSIEVYNADFAVQDLDAQGKLTIEDSKVEVDGAFASATFYATTLTNTEMVVNGNQIDGGLGDFSGGTSNQLGNVKINNSTLTIKEGDTKVAANVTATNSTIAVNNLTVNSGKTLNLNEGSALSAENITTAGTGSVKIDGVKAEISGGQAFIPVAQIGEQKYATLNEALEATKTMTGDVTVEIYDKVTFNQPLIGNYTSINFVGKEADAEMYLDVQGYTTATGKKVSFTDLKLSKSEGGFITNAGFMNVAFGIYDVEEVTYTNCTFENGACASSGKVTFNGCTFKKSWDKYGLWAYGNVDVTVQGSTFADYRGIKMYAENGAAASVEKANLTVKNTNFSAVNNKPAIVLTYGESVVLEGNTYSSTGTFELDLDGKPNGVAVTSDVAPVCVNDNGACGVLVDGKIYTTVAQAAEVATETSTVTLLHSSNETVEFPMGTTIEKNGFTADNVTTAQPFAEYVVLPVSMTVNNYKALFGTNAVTDGTNYYATLQAAVEAVAQNAGVTRQANAVLYCKPGADVGSLQHAPVVSTLTIYGNGANVTGGSERDFDLGNTDPNGGRDITADMTLTVKHLNGCGAWGAKATGHTVNLVFENCANMGKVFISGTTGTLNITMKDCAFEGVLKEAVYSNADGAITLNNVAFSNLNKAINLNHKAAGTQTVTINGCSFTNCGADVAADQIPVRVLSSVDGGKTVLNVSNATFTGTPEGGADILLDYGVGLTEATVASTTANVVVEKENNVGTKTEVSTDNNYEFTTAKPVANIGNVEYATLEEAAAAAQVGDVITLNTDATLSAALTLPAGITLNGNGKQINGTIVAAGDITFAGVTKAGDLDFAVGNTVVNIPAGASLQLNGSARMSIGFGTTFNIVGTIEDAKTADKATVVPSLVIPGASFSGAGVKFNVTNAYISVPSSYCSTSKSASGTFDFNITNSIWESAGKLAFEEQSVNAKVDFALVNSVLTTGSHLVFGTASGEEGVVIDNSYVNQGTSRQLENCGTMTVKNGSVVNGAVATSSNAKNPGTVIVENATYAVTGEFSGSDLGTGTLVIKKGATVSAGSITKANITVDAKDMTAADEINLTANLSKLAGTLSVINNDKLEAKIVDGKIVLAAKPVAKIGEQGYATLEAAFAAATEGQTITMLDDATPALTSQRAITKAAVIDLGGKTMTLTEDDLYFGTTTFKNGTIVVDPSVKPSTAVFWMFANQTLTFDNVKIVATGVTGTYLIGLDGDNSDLNLLNGSEILVENTTALDLDIICVNGTNTCDIKVENSKVNVTNLDGRVFFRGNYTVKDSEVNLAGITKAGFRIEAGQTLSIEGTSKVNIEGEPRDGGIHMTDLSATYTKAETATVNATVNEPKVAKVGENTYRTLAQAVAVVEDGGTITLIANETFTKNNRYNNGGWWDGLGYSGDKSFTIDLADFTISQDGALNDYLMWFKNDGAKANTITLKNGTLDAGTTAYCAIATASSNAQKITVNLENIKVINNNSNGSTLKIRGGAELNVKAGTEITGKNSYLGIECVASTVNIYDGAKIYMNGTSSYNGCLVGACGGGTVNVYGGYGKGVKGGFIAMTSGGTINVAGGEWIANTDGTVGNNSNLYVLTAQSNKYESGFAGASIINVTGGTLRGGMDAWVLNNLEGEKAELNISGGNFNANPSRYLAENYIATENNGVWTVAKAAAKVGNVLYASLEAAFKAATSGCTIDILSDVTVDYNWDARFTGAKFTVPVTINGNDKTIKFTASVNDNNYQAPFRFEADATVKNLTIDMSEVTDNRFRAISSKGNLTVDGSKFIGKDESLNCRAIIFGEGAGANVGNLAISITNSEFINWKRGITDNENAQDVKTVTITGNKLTDAGVGVSAKETVTFTGNTVAGAYVNIKSYTAGNSLNVVATDNTLEENTETAYNVINAGGTINAQEGFNASLVAKIGEATYGSLQVAVNAVKNGETITLTSDVTENVTLTEKVGLYYTIDGAGKTMDGSISVTPLSDTEDNRRITIKNINFVNNADAARDFISSVATNHYPRLTVEGCTFTGNGKATDVAVRLKSSHSVVIKNCTATGLHSFIQNTSGWNLTIEEVTVTDSKSGFALGTVQGVTVKGCEADVEGYGIRLDAQYNNNAVIESNKIEAFIPVVVRKAEVNSNVTVQGTNTMTATNTDGLWMAVGTSEYEENGQMPTAATAEVKVALTDTGLDAAGIYGSYYDALTIHVGATQAGRMVTRDVYVATMDEAVAEAKAISAGAVIYKVYGEVELTTGGSHGILDLGKNVVIEGADATAKLTIVGGGVPDIKGVTFKNIILADEGTYLPTANEFMYQNYIDCTFENVTFVDGIRLSGTSSIKDSKVDANTTNEYAIWLDEGEFTMTGTTVVGGADAYGLVKSDAVSKITISGNTFQYLGEANKEALNVKGAVVIAENNKFIDCVKGILPADKTNYTDESKTTVATDATIAPNNTVTVNYAAIGEQKYETLLEAINAVQEGQAITLLRDVTMDYNARDAFKTNASNVVINGNGKTLTLNQTNSDWSSFGLANNRKLVLNNMTIEKTGYGDTNGAWNTHAIIFSCPVEMNGVTVNNSVAVQAGAALTNVTINEANGYYGLWINGNGQTVTVNGGAINATNGGRGIKIADQYIDAPAQVTLSVDGTVFSTAKKAAVLVSSTAGAKIAAANVNIANVAEDSENFVWVDEDWAQHFGNVEVTGATVRAESAATFTAAITANGAVQAYYKTLAEAIKACVAGDNTITLLADCAEKVTITQVNGTNITINGNGKTYTGTITVKGDKVANNLYNTETLTFKNINFAPAYNTYAITAEKNTYARNITVDGCTFKGNNDVYGIRVRNGYNYTVKNTTVEGVYTFFNASEALNGLTVENVTVKCASVAFSGAYGYGNASFKNVTVESGNNGIKVNNPNGSALTFEGCSITAKAPVTFYENAGVTSALTAEFNGTNTMVVSQGGTYWFNIVEADATDATFKAIVNDANLDMSNTAFVASVGNVYYSSLQKAINEAADGATVVIARDIELNAANCVTNSDGYSVFVNVAGKAVTIDLNGKAVTANLSASQFASAKSSLLLAVFSVDTNGNLTLNDTKGTGKVAVTANDASVYSLISNYDKSSKLTINDGSYELDKARANSSLIHSDPSEAVVVNGGNFYLGNVNTGANGSPWIFNVNGTNTGHVIVNGGTYNFDVAHQYYEFEVSIDKTFAMKNNGNGTWTVVPATVYVAEESTSSQGYTNYVGYVSVAEALAHAKEVGMTDLEITIIGTNDASTTDNFDLVYTALFEKVTIKQDNGGAPYYFYDIYTGKRANDGKFLFDGVNIVVTDQYMFEGNVELTNNSVVKSVAEANCFVYYANVTVEAGSKIDGVIEDIRGGSLIIDGGKTDGTYSEVPGLSDAILVVNWTDSKLVLQNGAYVKINSANEIGRLTVNGTLDVLDSKLDSYQWITVNSDAVMNLNIGSIVTTKAINGAGKITVDATYVTSEPVTVISADMTGFTGTIELTGNEYAIYEKTNEGLVIKSTYVDDITIVDGAETEFVNQDTKTVGTLTYQRTFKSTALGVWQPLFVPFEIPVATLNDMGYEVVYFNDFREVRNANLELTGESIVEMVKLTSGTLKANYPYAIRTKDENALELNLVLNNVKLYSTEGEIEPVECSSAIKRFNFRGTYKKADRATLTGSNDAPCYAMSGGDFAPMSATAKLSPFRVYLTVTKKDGSPYIEGDESSARTIRLEVIGEENENGETIIYDVVGTEQKSEAIFDLQGRRVLSPVKGNLYIINGKKVVY